MAIVTSYATRRAILSQLLPLATAWWLRLYVNDHTPTPADTAADYVEPTGSWYAPLILDQWGQTYNTATGLGRVDNVIRTYTAAGTLADESVYGYWVATDNFQLVWAERGPLSPYPMNTAGRTVRVLPRLSTGELC